MEAQRTATLPLVAIFQMHGYSARFFTSPLEALAARTKSPDLLIPDDRRMSTLEQIFLVRSVMLLG